MINGELCSVLNVFSVVGKGGRRFFQTIVGQYISFQKIQCIRFFACHTFTAVRQRNPKRWLQQESSSTLGGPVSSKAEQESTRNTNDTKRQDNTTSHYTKKVDFS